MTSKTEENDRLVRAEGFALASFNLTLMFLHRAVARKEMTKEHAALVIGGACEILKATPTLHDPAALAYAEKVLKLTEEQMRSGSSPSQSH